jgi:hypothetical protein
MVVLLPDDVLFCVLDQLDEHAKPWARGVSLVGYEVDVDGLTCVVLDEPEQPHPASYACGWTAASCTTTIGWWQQQLQLRLDSCHPATADQQLTPSCLPSLPTHTGVC